MDDRSTAISAAEVADDRAEIAAAVKVAKAFRDKAHKGGRPPQNRPGDRRKPVPGIFQGWAAPEL